MNKENKNEQKERIMKEYKKLNLINFALMLPLGAACIIIPSAVFQALLPLSDTLAMLIACATEIIAIFGLSLPCINIFCKREDSLLNLLEKIKLQEEYEKLKDEDKEIVKAVAKDENVIKYNYNIRINTKLTKEQWELVKNVNLNRNVKNYLCVVDEKQLIKSFVNNDFDKEKLDKEYNEVMSSKKLVKRKNK